MSVGQINSDFRKSCQAPERKNIPLHISVNQNYNLSSHPRGGASAVVTERWDGMRWTRAASGGFSPDEALFAYGEVVWSWRRDAGVKLVEASLKVTVANKPVHRGEHEVSRKAIAQGMSECFRCPVCSCAPNVQFLAHETAGAARTRHSLRPLFRRRAQRICKTSGETRRENAFRRPLRQWDPCAAQRGAVMVIDRAADLRDPAFPGGRRPAFAAATVTGARPDTAGTPAIPTISCINISHLPQPLGRRRPIWYPQGQLPTATRDRPHLANSLRRWRYFADEPVLARPVQRPLPRPNSSLRPRLTRPIRKSPPRSRANSAASATRSS